MLSSTLFESTQSPPIQCRATKRFEVMSQSLDSAALANSAESLSIFRFRWRRPKPSAPAPNHVATKRRALASFAAGYFATSRSILRRRVRGREAVTSYAPSAVVALLEDEELLIGFRSGFAGGRVRGRPSRIRAHVGPGRSQLYELRDVEPDVEFQFLEHAVVRLAYGFAPDRGLTVRGHEDAIIRIEGQHRSGVAPVQGGVICGHGAFDPCLVLGIGGGGARQAACCRKKRHCTYGDPVVADNHSCSPNLIPESYANPSSSIRLRSRELDFQIWDNDEGSQFSGDLRQSRRCRKFFGSRTPPQYADLDGEPAH